MRSVDHFILSTLLKMRQSMDFRGMPKRFTHQMPPSKYIRPLLTHTHTHLMLMWHGALNTYQRRFTSCANRIRYPDNAQQQISYKSNIMRCANNHHHNHHYQPSSTLIQKSIVHWIRAKRIFCWDSVNENWTAAAVLRTTTNNSCMVECAPSLRVVFVQNCAPGACQFHICRTSSKNDLYIFIFLCFCYRTQLHTSQFLMNK